MRRTLQSTRPALTLHRHPSQVARRAVAYARVSSKDQEREGFSIPAQQGLLRAYAADQGIVIAEEFVDVETAKRAGRTSFTKMLAYLRTSGVRVVLVEKTDRLYRNLKDWVTLDGMDLEIHLVKEAAVLSEGSRSSEKFIHGIKVLMAKNYVENLSEETRKGMLEKARQGIWPSKAPLGYRNVVRPDGKRIIALDGAVAPLMRQLFEWYDSGEHSLRTLADKARSAGLGYRRSGDRIPASYVHQMLQNPLYYGDFEWDGVHYQGTHPAIVSRDLWERVQERLHGRLNGLRAVRRHDFAFAGLLRCGPCADEGHERALIGSVAKGQYHYYHCERCKELGRRRSHPAIAIDTAFASALGTLRLDAEVMDWVKGALRSSMVDEKAEVAAAQARLQADYDKLQRRLDVAYDDKVDGRIDAATFDRKAREWREAQARIRSELAAHEVADQSYMESGVALLELAQRTVELYESQEAGEKSKLLGFVTSNSYWDGQSLRVGWREPFDLLAQSVIEVRALEAAGGAGSGQNEKWLPLPDSNRGPTD